MNRKTYAILGLAVALGILCLAPIIPPPSGGGGGSSVWGAITGTLSAQTDLQAALDAKQTESQVQALIDAVLDPNALTTSDDTAPTSNAVKVNVDNLVTSIGTVAGDTATALAVANAAIAANIGTAFFDPTGGSIGGATVTGNIASVVWASAGNYDVLFTTPEADANYVVSAVSETDNQPGYFAARNKTVNGFTLRSFTPEASLTTGAITYTQTDLVMVGMKVSR